MKRKDLVKENNRLNNRITELMADIEKLIEEDYSIERELVKLKYISSIECEKLTWSAPMVSSDGFLNLINHQNTNKWEERKNP